MLLCECVDLNCIQIGSYFANKFQLSHHINGISNILMYDVHTQVLQFMIYFIQLCWCHNYACERIISNTHRCLWRIRAIVVCRRKWRSTSTPLSAMPGKSCSNIHTQSKISYSIGIVIMIHLIWLTLSNFEYSLKYPSFAKWAWQR